jgi:hypothetical protein
VIRESVLGRVDFVHRTFQEYLAAKEAVEDQTAETLIARAHLDQWRETLVMAVGHATPERRAALLSGVLDRADAEPRHRRWLRLLAASCLEALKLLARWAPDPRRAVQRALAGVWRYFDPADYAQAVLRDSPLDGGKIRVEVVKHRSRPNCRLR